MFAKLQGNNLNARWNIHWLVKYSQISRIDRQQTPQLFVTVCLSWLCFHFSPFNQMQFTVLIKFILQAYQQVLPWSVVFKGNKLREIYTRHWCLRQTCYLCLSFKLCYSMSSYIVLKQIFIETANNLYFFKAKYCYNAKSYNRHVVLA